MSTTTQARPATAGRAVPIPPRKAPMTDQTTPPNVGGLDLSLTATAYAWSDQTIATVGQAGLTSVGRPLAERAFALDDLAKAIFELTRSRRANFDHRAPRLIAIEGLPTTGTKVDSERCYLWWRVVHLLCAYGTPLIVVPPSTVKLYASGMGNANKREVIAAAKRDLPGWEIRKTSKTGKVLTTDDDNKADAAWLMAIAAHLLGQPLVPVTPFRERALEKLILPEMPF